MNVQFVELNQASLARRHAGALWRLGFRPFFLLASLFAPGAILAWLLIRSAAVPPMGSMDSMLWHAHEMIFGYSSAVIAGFVLTASQNWTGIPGVRGRKLQILAALWVAGRLAMAGVREPSAAVALIDLAFYPALALALFPYLRPADMRIERVFFAYFALYFAGNAMMHAEALGWIHGFALRGALLGVHTTVLMIVFMGGRVIPFFTESEKSHAQPRTHAWLEFLSHASAGAFLVTQFLSPNSVITAAVAFAAALIHGARLRGWYVRRIRRIAVLWVLHLAYLWIAIGFALSGFASLGWIPLGPAVHALTVGGLGMMTYGMMSRVALGHTGRRLRPDRLIIAGYALLSFSTLTRVLGPILASGVYEAWVQLSGTLWIAAFALFLVIYGPILTRARLDGRSG